MGLRLIDPVPAAAEPLLTAIAAARGFDEDAAVFAAEAQALAQMPDNS